MLCFINRNTFPTIGLSNSLLYPGDKFDFAGDSFQRSIFGQFRNEINYQFAIAHKVRMP